MKNRLLSVGLLALSAACSTPPSGTSPALVSPVVTSSALAAQGAARDVIVILKEQMPTMSGRGSFAQVRASAIAASHAPLINQLTAARQRDVKSFQTVNAFKTSMTAAEITAFSTHPLVQAVVPDRTIRLPKRFRDRVAGEATGVGSAAGRDPATLCNTLEPEALQVTHAAFADPTVPQAQTVKDGHGVPVTGVGVKVAYVADGLDPNIPGFIRPDGTKVFVDYQDFSGDPAGTPTGGGEAFLDASSIAAQDTVNYDISQYVSAAHPLPSPCNIRVRGMAPGASLVGLDVYSSLGYTTTSTFVQAIEYAVVVAGVDIINESFGGNPIPDEDNDPIALANAAATRAGVTVVASSGDAGTAGTLGSPSTASDVIEAGASTTFRVYEQLGDGLLPVAKGYVSNNISSLSSGGFAERKARTVDLVAPGDLNWALCSTNTAQYQDCVSFNGGPTPVAESGGTSESSPLTAGAAALVLQAYRSTHGGASPSPALVKRILMSASRDLGAPALSRAPASLTLCRR